MREATSLLLYGILEAPLLPDEPVHAVQGQPVVLLRAEEAGLWAAVSRLPEPSRVNPPKADDALAYHRALQALHMCTTVLPLRYGTVLSGAAEVRALLTAGREEYRALLARLAGCHEFGIRAQPAPPAAAASRAPSVGGDAGDGQAGEKGHAGASYLRARLRHYQAEELESRGAEALIARLGAALGSQARAQYAQFRSSPSSPSASPVLSMSFLVPRDQEQAFRRTFAEVQRAEAQRLQLLGPWPPYSFLSTGCE